MTSTNQSPFPLDPRYQSLINAFLYQGNGENLKKLSSELPPSAHTSLPHIDPVSQTHSPSNTILEVSLARVNFLPQATVI